jgi:hypothetical protein
VSNRHAKAAAALVAQWITDGNQPTDPTAHARCICGAPRADHSGKAQSGACADTGCKRYREHPVEALALRAWWANASRDPMTDVDDVHNRDRDKRIGKMAADEWGVGPSDTGSCRKAIEYRERPPEGFEPLPEDSRAAAVGTAVHATVEAARRRLYPWREFSVPVVIPGLDRKGEADEYDGIVADVTDYKTAGEYVWEWIVGPNGPKDDQWEQVMMYGYGLRLTGREVRTVTIEYVRRATGEGERFTRPYDEAVALAALDRLMAINTSLDLGQELPRDRSGPSDDPLCRRCFARAHCWNMTAAEAAGRTPEGFTLVQDKPEIAWALAEYDRGRSLEKEGKEIKERHRGLLDGLQANDYGAFTLSWSGGKPKAPAPDIEARVNQLESFYDLPDGNRPPLIDLPFPTVVRTPKATIGVKATRLAKRIERGDQVEGAEEITGNEGAA